MIDVTLLNGIFWILQTGAPWRDLPERFGPWQTVYHHFAKWRREGVFAEIIEVLQVTLDDCGLIDWDLWCIGGANVRDARTAAGAGKKVWLASRRTGGPRFGPQQRRVWVEVPLGY